MSKVNILGTIAAIVAFTLSLLTGVLGCTTNVAGVANCSASFLTPQLAGYITMLFTGVLLLSKMFRTGGPIKGLFGSTAVIVPPSEAMPGVVTPAQVNAPANASDAK